jgi:hypothetical protein
MHFLIISFRLNKLAFHDHITGMRPRPANKLSLCDDANLRASDLIALSAKYAQDPAIFNTSKYSELGEGLLMLNLEGRSARVHTFARAGERFRRVLKICYVETGSSAENPNHDCNHIAFTVDYPDAAKPSHGVTVHPLSQCYCRYLVTNTRTFQISFTVTLAHHTQYTRSLFATQVY